MSGEGSVLDHLTSIPDEIREYGKRCAFLKRDKLKRNEQYSSSVARLNMQHSFVIGDK